MKSIPEERLSRLYSWMAGQPSFPTKIIFIITYNCNLNCIFCGWPTARKNINFEEKEELSASEWLKVVNEASKLGVLEWEMIGYGEAMMKAQTVLAIIKTIKSLNPLSDCLLTTNGTMFTKEIIKEMVEAKIDRIQFSIDGPDEKTHDFLRGQKGVFKKSLNAIKTFSDLKKEFGENKPKISINMVVNAKNHNKIREMIKVASQNGIDEVLITPMRIEKDNSDRVIKYGLKMDDYQKKEFYSHVSQAQSLAKKLNVKFDLLITKGKEEIVKAEEKQTKEKNAREKFLSAPCYEPFYSMLIDPEGNVGICLTSAAFTNKNLNIRKMSLKKIWFSDYFNWAREMRLNDRTLPQCDHCTIIEMRNRLRKDLMNYCKNMETIKEIYS